MGDWSDTLILEESFENPHCRLSDSSLTIQAQTMIETIHRNRNCLLGSKTWVENRLNEIGTVIRTDSQPASIRPSHSLLIEQVSFWLEEESLETKSIVTDSQESCYLGHSRTGADLLPGAPYISAQNSPLYSECRSC